MIPHELVLETSKVLLRPVEPNDYETFLHLAKQDEEMWKYFSLNLGDEAQLRKWMEMASTDKKAETRRPFTIIDKATGQI
ncbi:MAG TPA: GNAT family N-acetyltransferase, partial [Chitinophagaceae bacterium]|nr:GNAT family N-acetyltransferase [Chitinophagaceae bacterium]